MAEYNPVPTATTDPGKFSILGDSSYDWGGPQTVDPSTLTQAPGMPDFSSMDDTQLSSYLGQGGSSGWGNILAGLSGLSGLTGTSGSQQQQSSSGGALNWLESLLGIGGGNAAGALSGLGPYAAVGAYGLNQAKSAQKDAQAKANELKGLGTPYLDASKKLLDQYMGGTLRPEQQRVVDFTSEEGQKLIDSGQGLSAIAQQAFLDYQNGKLPAADEQKLQADITRQKQELRQKLSSSGIQDSSILAGYDQQIDAQATQTRQDLLDKRFATGNQAYDEWLKSTTQGQALKLQGQMFAQEAFQSMMNNALGLGAEGMQPVMQSVALAIQSDQELSQQVSELIGNLAAAWSYQQAGKNGAPGTTGGTSGGGGQSTLQQIIGGVSSVGSLISGIGKLFGWGSDNPSGAGGQAAGTWTPPTTDPGMSVPTGTDTSAGSYSSLSNLGSGALGAYGIYSGIQQGASTPQGAQQIATGTKALAGAGSQVASAAGATGTAGALGTLATGAGYGAAAIAAGQLIHKAFNANGSVDRNRAAFSQIMQEWGEPTQIARIGAKGMFPINVYNVPGIGPTMLTQKDIDELAGNWYGAVYHPDGDPEGWQKKLEGTMARLQQNNTMTPENVQRYRSQAGGAWNQAAIDKYLSGGG